MKSKIIVLFLLGFACLLTLKSADALLRRLPQLLFGRRSSNTARSAVSTLESANTSPPRVTTPLGTVEGYYDTAFGGTKFEAYEGIPFAKPPVGDLRFEVAESITPWEGILEAKRFGSPCLQYNLLDQTSSNKVAGSEDCLYLNVYSPVRTNKVNGNAQLLPVIFFIHGGAFIFGAGSLYEPDYLMDRKVVLVTINYRLGPLGFLNTEDATVPGNVGLKDQVMALRWVKDNIKSFGGNPIQVTIVGQSAGGASVHYHYMTSLTQDLFKRGISLSGNALNPWAYVKNPLKIATRLADIVECPNVDTQEMVKCLKATPANDLVNAVAQFSKNGVSLPVGWAPSMEERGGNFTFIDRSPKDIMASGDIHDLPWLTGIVSEEGLYPGATYIANEASFTELNDNWEADAPYVLFFTESVPECNQSQVSNIIRNQYFSQNNISNTTFNDIARLLSDRMFVVSFEEAIRVQVQANRSPVYNYYFSYRGAHSFSELLGKTTEDLGVCHYDDLSYVLQSFFNATTTSEDRKMQQVLIDLWVSFATNGAPNVGVTWPRLSQSSTGKLRYMHIAGPKKIQMEETTSFGDTAFWNSIDFS